MKYDLSQDEVRVLLDYRAEQMRGRNVRKVQGRKPSIGTYDCGYPRDRPLKETVEHWNRCMSTQCQESAGNHRSFKAEVLANYRLDTINRS